MGFRGEALFSIGNVSLVNVKSRNLLDNSGFELVFQAGKKILHEKIFIYNKALRLKANWEVEERLVIE